MIECTIAEEFGLKWLKIQGRIDAMGAPEVEKQVEDIIDSGERIVVVDFSRVNYISSVGLRVLIGAQKQLHKVNGEVILYDMPPNVEKLIEMSGFNRLFSIASTMEEVIAAAHIDTGHTEALSRGIDGISVKHLEMETDPGSLSIIGSQEFLSKSEYVEGNVVSVRPVDMRYGTGLAALGDQYEDYRDYFGESVVINGNLFVYPAAKHAAVDCMMPPEGDSGIEYRFFHGFGFNGSWRHIVAFEGVEDSFDLTALVDTLVAVTDADIIGIVFFAETRGIWGMNLKRVPLLENKPENGQAIFATDNFPVWVEFPVEPAGMNQIICGAGIAIRDRSGVSAEVRNLISEESRFHIHAGLFDKEPISKKPEQYEDELNRLLNEVRCNKVQHMLGQTRLSFGTAGIIELKE